MDKNIEGGAFRLQWCRSEEFSGTDAGSDKGDHARVRVTSERVHSDKQRESCGRTGHMKVAGVERGKSVPLLGCGTNREVIRTKAYRGSSQSLVGHVELKIGWVRHENKGGTHGWTERTTRRVDRDTTPRRATTTQQSQEWRTYGRHSIEG